MVGKGRSHPARQPGAVRQPASPARRCLPGGNAVVRRPQRGTEAPVKAVTVRPAEPLPGRGSLSLRKRSFALAAPGLIVLVPAYLFLGTMFVSVDLSTVDFAARSGFRQAAGGRDPRLLRARQRDRRSVVRVAELAGARLAAARGHPVADPGRGVHVLGDAEPARGAGDRHLPVRADHRAHPDRRVQPAGVDRAPGPRDRGDEWLGTGISVGVALGATAVGFILFRRASRGPRWGYAFAAASGVTTVAIYLSGLRRLSSPRPAAS